MRSRVELAGDDPRGEARVRGLHLVRTDHREPVAERKHDRGVDTRQRARSDEVPGDASTRVVRSAPLNQWTRNRFAASASSGSTLARADAATDAGASVGSASCANVGSAMPAVAEASDRSITSCCVDDFGLETERRS